jgi:hypothetical protein
MLREWNAEWTNDNIDRDFSYVGVVYRKHVELSAPRMFQNPLSEEADAQAYAQATLFIPRPRLRHPWKTPVLGEDRESGQIIRWDYVGDGWSPEWSTFNQNWTIKLVPATAESLPQILGANPGGPVAGIRVPNMNGVSMRDVHVVNTH